MRRAISSPGSSVAADEMRLDEFVRQVHTRTVPNQGLPSMARCGTSIQPSMMRRAVRCVVTLSTAQSEPRRCTFAPTSIMPAGCPRRSRSGRRRARHLVHYGPLDGCRHCGAHRRRGRKGAVRILHRDGACHQVDVLYRNAPATAALVRRRRRHDGNLRNSFYSLVRYLDTRGQAEQHHGVTADLLQCRLQRQIAVQLRCQTRRISAQLRRPHVDHGQGRVDDGDSYFAAIGQLDLLPWDSRGQERSP